jgi:hypothetical protein
VKFLHDSEEDLSLNLNIDHSEIMAFRYNVLKYYVMLLRQLLDSLRPDVFEKKYPKCKWKEFFKTSEFSTLKREISDLLGKAEIKVSEAYDKCKSELQTVRKFNPKIEHVLEP